MPGQRSRLPRLTSGPHVHTWRVTTAARAFVLIVAATEVIGVGAPTAVSAALVGLAAAATGFCLLERQPGLGTAWVPAAEGFLVAVLVDVIGQPVEPVLVCLALPAVVAGIQRGRRAVLVTTVVTAGALLLVGRLLAVLVDRPLSASLALPWLVLGLGAGLLAAAQSRSAREAAAVQASYAAAHDLVGQLHDLVQELSMDLDPRSLAEALVEQVRSFAGSTHTAVWVRNADHAMQLLASEGRQGPSDERRAVQCLDGGAVVRSDVSAAVPLRVGEHTFGAVLLTTVERADTSHLTTLQALVDNHAVRLDTALLVEAIRSEATSEERRRLARDIHDGVAQRAAGLGYLADEILEIAIHPGVELTAAQLRAEVTTLLSELRSSVFDLRQEVGCIGLPAALSGYVQEVSGRTALRVHLSLDERGARLPLHVEAEVFRIAQEAITNVDRHARAVNVWVHLTTDGHDFRLTVEDDGVGGAKALTGHYGMHTMRERAARLGAELAVDERQDGGTAVRLRTRTADRTSHDQWGEHHDDTRAAHR